MADPILNESMILVGLSPPASLENIDQLQEASWLSIANAYDRKIERDEFIKLISAAMTMNNNLGRLQVTVRVREMMERNKLTKENIDAAATQLIGYSEVARLELYRLTELVAQCPTSLDKVC